MRPERFIPVQPTKDMAGALVYTPSENGHGPTLLVTPHKDNPVRVEQQNPHHLRVTGHVDSLAILGTDSTTQADIVNFRGTAHSLDASGNVAVNTKGVVVNAYANEEASINLARPARHVGQQTDGHVFSPRPQ